MNNKVLKAHTSVHVALSPLITRDLDTPSSCNFQFLYLIIFIILKKDFYAALNTFHALEKNPKTWL